MLAEILVNPVKRWMLVVLIVITVASEIGLIVMWKKAVREAKEHERILQRDCTTENDCKWSATQENLRVQEMSHANGRHDSL